MATKQELESQNAELREAVQALQSSPVMFSTRVPGDIVKQIKTAAVLDGRSVQHITAEALQMWLEHRKTNAPELF